MYHAEIHIPRDERARQHMLARMVDRNIQTDVQRHSAEDGKHDSQQAPQFLATAAHCQERSVLG